MPILKGNNKIVNILKGTTQIEKVYRGTTLLWESWSEEEGVLASVSWSGVSYGGLTYSSGEINLNGSYKIKEFTFFNEILRADITGKEEGRYIAYGWDGNRWVTLLDVVSSNSTQWACNSVTSSNDTETVITKIKYELYVYDSISRKYSGTMKIWISSWEES